MTHAIRRTYEVGDAVKVVAATERDGHVTARVDDEDLPGEIRLLGPIDGGAVVSVDGASGPQRAVVVRDGDRVLVHYDGHVHTFALHRSRGDAHHAQEGADDPFAASPMTGVVLDLKAEPGQAVAAGDALFVIEAMKMEFVVEAPRDVVVNEVLGAAGDRVDIGQVLVTFVVEETPAESAE